MFDIFHPGIAPASRRTAAAERDGAARRVAQPHACRGAADRQHVVSDHVRRERRVVALLKHRECVHRIRREGGERAAKARAEEQRRPRARASAGHRAEHEAADDVERADRGRSRVRRMRPGSSRRRARRSGAARRRKRHLRRDRSSRRRQRPYSSFLRRRASVASVRRCVLHGGRAMDSAALKA